MPAVRGPKFLADPEGEATRFAVQLHAEAAAQEAVPPRYVWKGGYWCAVKNGTWPNVTGWAEHRLAQRIYTRKLGQLKAARAPRGKVQQRASEYTRAEMLAHTTERKEASDRYYAQLGSATPDDAGTGSQPTTD